MHYTTIASKERNFVLVSIETPLFRQATFYLAELFRQATFYLAELSRQIAFSIFLGWVAGGMSGLTLTIEFKRTL